jgi:GNAT superfamily N-acetyltransferase
MPYTIDFLGNHPALVPLVARWHWDEWGTDYDGASLEAWTAQLAGKTHTDGVPCSWIAFVDATPVGSVVLESDGVEPRTELTPDLAGLYVLPGYRGHGIGSALVRACEDGARSFGVTKLYLYTEAATALYTRLGWETLEVTTFQAKCAVIMQRSLLTG